MTSGSTHRKNRAYLPFLLPGLAGVALFTFLPFADSLRRSFFTSSGRFAGLENFAVTIDNEAFRLAVWNTARFTAVSLPLLIVSAFILAYLLCRLKFCGVIRSVLLFPMAVPTAVLVLIWKILFSDNGCINGILASHGIEGIQFLDSGASFWLLVVSFLWKNLGYTVLLWMTGIIGLPASITEAARVDGANERQVLVKIMLPNLRPTLYTITIITFLNSFKVFREAFLVAGSYPHKSIYLLQHLFNNWFVNLDLDKMAAASVIVFAVIFAAIMLLRKVWNNEN